MYDEEETLDNVQGIRGDQTLSLEQTILRHYNSATNAIIMSTENRTYLYKAHTSLTVLENELRHYFGEEEWKEVQRIRKKLKNFKFSSSEDKDDYKELLLERQEMIIKAMTKKGMMPEQTMVMKG